MFNHLLFAALLCCGLLLVYRGTLHTDDYRVFNGKVTGKDIEVIDKKRNGSERYGLVLKINHLDRRIGIYLGTDNEISGDSWINKIQLNKNYKFFMDPSVINSNDINLGLRKIMKGETVLFEEKMDVQFYIGLGFTMFIAFFWYVYAKKQK